MEAEPPESNLSSIKPLVGDEPSRTEDAAHASESGKAADTHGYHSQFSPESVAIHPDHAKVIHEAAQYYALIYGTQAPVASTDHTFILVLEMSSVLYISNSKRSCASPGTSAS